MNPATRLLADPRLATLLGALAPTGAETRIVGGAVRDALIGLAPHEIDLATTAMPEATMAAAEAAGLRAIPPKGPRPASIPRAGRSACPTLSSSSPNRWR